MLQSMEHCEKCTSAFSLSRWVGRRDFYARYGEVSMNMQVHEKRLLNELKQKQKDFLFTQQESTYTLQNDLQHNEKYEVFWSEGG